MRCPKHTPKPQGKQEIPYDFSLRQAVERLAQKWNATFISQSPSRTPLNHAQA